MPRVRDIVSIALNGRLDMRLAAGLGVLCLSVGLGRGSDPLEIATDLVACAAAAGTVRWPRTAGVVLMVVVYGYLLAPVNWSAMGSYAVLVPILGTGMRGEHRARRWFTAAYFFALPGLVYRYSPGVLSIVFGTMIWAAIIAVVWVMGTLFAAQRRAAVRDAEAAAMERQIAVARDLHDSVARTLHDIVIQARQQRAANDPDALDDLLVGCELALGELRDAMLSMREVPGALTDRRAPRRQLSQALDEAKDTLADSGFAPTVAVDGYPAQLDPDVEHAVVAALDEAVANVQRHGTAPCRIVATTDTDGVEIVILNGVAPQTSGDRPGIGLLGASERLQRVGGILDSSRQEMEWLTRIAAPAR